MIAHRVFSIEKDNTTKDGEKRSLDKETAQAKILDLINHSGKRRSFLDISRPGVILLAYCDDSEECVNCYVFEGPDDEIRPLQLFALREKSEKKRRDNATGDLAKPSDN